MSANPTIERDCLPSARQTNLLQAALLSGPEALAAWERWIAAVDIENLDGGSYRLLPLLAHNLTALGVDHPDLPRLLGVRRKTWFTNQLHLRALESTLALLDAAAIPHLVFKGAALATQVYPDLGLRPMADCDVLVPLEDAPRAYTTLLANGWRPKYAQRPTPTFLQAEKGLTLCRDAHEIDIHWRIMPPTPVSSTPTHWAAAQPLQIGTTATRTLCPSDHFMLVCTHGIEWNQLPPFRWAADALLLLRAFGPALDWERIYAQAAASHVLLPLRTAVRYLAIQLHAEFPAEFRQHLDDYVPTAEERLAYRLRILPVTLPRAAWRMWFHHSQLQADLPLLRKAARFPRYLQGRWSLDHPLAIGGKLLNSGSRHARAAVARLTAKKPSS